VLTFKQFLEAKVSEYEHRPLQGHVLANYIKEHCGEALKAWQDGHGIYRGSRGATASGLYNPGSGERTSANTNNYYTSFLDTNPKNKGWPKRSKSFICSTSTESADGYGRDRGGKTFTVFPFDGTPIGVVNRSDIWHLGVEFRGGFYLQDTIKGMNDIIPNFIEKAGKPRSWVPTLDEFHDLIKSMPPEDFEKECLEMNLETHSADPKTARDSFADQLYDAYSYDQLDCEKKTPGTVKHERSEVWFDSNCIMVTDRDLIIIRDELR